MDKIEMFRDAIQRQADEDISTLIAEMHERRAAADKTRGDLALKDALNDIKKETDEINSQFRRDMSKCDYDYKRAVLMHRNELISDFFKDIEDSLVKFVQSEEGYTAYLKRSVEKIRASIALDNATLIYARPQDVDIVRTLTSCEVTADNTIRLGGIRAVCRTKNVFCDVTLDMALEDEKRAFTQKTELRL